MTEKVFLDYDQAGLDRQLNLRARWPEHAEHLARWARESAEVRHGSGGALDLTYGPGPGDPAM